MKKIKAEIIADSITEQGHRATTYVLTFPRFILAELNTHRLFSKNSASSRAIPFKKMVKMVEEDPFIPIAWQKDHKGMQGTEYADYPDTEDFKQCWLEARDSAVDAARTMQTGNVKCTKQLTNRLLEPFMWHTVILTATEYDNFFELRCPQYEWDGQSFKSREDCLDFVNKKSPVYSSMNTWNDLSWLKNNRGQGEIHMMELAECMYDAMNESTPKELKAGEWHIPFGDKMDSSRICELYTGNENQVPFSFIQACRVKIATARCARVSYLNFEGKDDYEADLKLYDILSTSGHWSPFEHCLRAMTEREYFSYIQGKLPVSKDTDGTLFIPEIYLEGEHSNVYIKDKNTFGWCRNMRGFVQLRELID